MVKLCVWIVFLCLSGAHMVTRGVHLSKCVVYLGIWPLDLVWSIGGLKHLTQNRIRISIHLNIYLQELDTSKSADWLLSVATVWGQREKEREICIRLSSGALCLSMFWYLLIVASDEWSWVFTLFAPHREPWREIICFISLKF